MKSLFSRLQLMMISKKLSFRSYLSNSIKIHLFWSPLIAILFNLAFNGLENFKFQFAISYSISLVCGFICMTGSYFFEFLLAWFSKKNQFVPIKKTPLRSILISYIFLVPGLYLGFKVAALILEQSGHKSFLPDFKNYSSGLIFGLLVSVLFLLSRIIQDSKEAKKQSEYKLQQLENEKLRAQVSALSAQLNPHLLFNSLNTIASTISTDPQSAEDMVVQLSELYRSVLKASKDDLHSLESELYLCKSYLEIERKRFGPRINYSIQIEDQINPSHIKIPVLLLQPLVENSIKHGLSPLKQGGKIWIEIKKNQEQLQIQIRDNGIGPNSGKKPLGTNTGLSNCESRIKLKYGKLSDFSFLRTDQNQTCVNLFLPLKEILQ